MTESVCRCSLVSANNKFFNQTVVGHILFSRKSHSRLHTHSIT